MGGEGGKQGRTRGDGLSGQDVDAEPALVEVLDVDGAAGEGGEQVDLGVVEQVVVLALEARVGLLLDLEDDIAGLDAGGLVALAAELDAGCRS